MDLFTWSQKNSTQMHTTRRNTSNPTFFQALFTILVNRSVSKAAFDDDLRNTMALLPTVIMINQGLSRVFGSNSMAPLINSTFVFVIQGKGKNTMALKIHANISSCNPRALFQKLQSLNGSWHSPTS